MIPRERAPYSAIVDRPPLKLPGGARLVVWTIVNLEFWDIARPMARQVLPAPTGQVLLPDVPNWSWHEYGMRVGVWRFFELFRHLAIRPTLSINARVCEDYQRVARAAHEAGWEFMGHAYEQGPMHLIEDQKAMIERSVAVIERCTGKKPVGWLGSGLAETWHTLDYLIDEGCLYVADWVCDDQPFRMDIGGGKRIVSIPYSYETNDSPFLYTRNGTIDQFVAAIKRQFDTLYAEGAQSGRVMAICLHPYLIGVPHRIQGLGDALDYIAGHDKVWFATGEEIVRAWLDSGATF